MYLGTYASRWTHCEVPEAAATRSALSVARARPHICPADARARGGVAVMTRPFLAINTFREKSSKKKGKIGVARARGPSRLRRDSRTVLLRPTDAPPDVMRVVYATIS